MKHVAIIGAGRLGKGFIGDEFIKAGWKVIFLDKDPEVIKKLNEGKYIVHKHTVEDDFLEVCESYDAYLMDEKYEVRDIFLMVDLVFLSLYPEDHMDALNYIHPLLTGWVSANPNRHLNLVSLTNKTGYTSQLDKQLKAWDNYSEIFEYVHLTDAIIRRSTDAIDTKSLEIETVAVNSLLIEKPLYIDISDVNWMEPCDHLSVLKEIKVFIVNGPHAATAYLGKLYGYTTIPESENDPVIAPIIQKVYEEIVAVCKKEYGCTDEEIKKLTYFPPAKGVMPDSIYRVAYDPIRKLATKDRLVGAIELAEKHGLSATSLKIAVAAGFCYKDPEDFSSVQIQKWIKEKGIEFVVSKVTGHPMNSKLVKDIVQQYQSIH